MKLLKDFLYIFFILNLFISNINAKDLTPSSSLIASGGVIDLVLNNDKLYVSTAASSVDIFDIKTQEKIDSIKMPKIKDFLGDIIDSKIYSVDILYDNILFDGDKLMVIDTCGYYKSNKTFDELLKIDEHKLIKSAVINWFNEKHKFVD